MLKTCNRCGEDKPIDNFPKNGKYTRNQCRSCINIRLAKWARDNRDKRAVTEKKWRSTNRRRYLDKRNESERKRHHIRKNSDLAYKLKLTLRRKFSQALKNNLKEGSAVQDLGCTIVELKEYLELKFSDGMTWANYGKWHIDHIKPLSAFDLTDREQVKLACHFTNLQPLWATDNLKKGAKYDSGT